MSDSEDILIDGADWPVFGWNDDIRPALAEAREAGRGAVLATLYKVEGSAPRGPARRCCSPAPKRVGIFRATA